MAAYWAGWAVVMAIGTYFLHATWPDWLRPPAEILASQFLGKMFLYVVATVAFARLGFLNLMPCRDLGKSEAVGLLTSVVLLTGVLAFSPVDPRGLAVEYRAELNWAVGPCGIFILFCGLVVGATFRRVARRGCATRPRVATAWTFAASACLATVSAEMLCRHESPSHMLIWHLLPLTLATLVGVVVAGGGEKALRNV